MDNLSIDWEQLRELLTVQGTQLGLNLLAAIGTYIVGRMIVSLIMKAVVKIMERTEFDELLERFVATIIRTFLNVFVIVAALTHLGFEMTTVVAVLGAAGLAVGLALQGSLSNFASGVLIIMFRPYTNGDYIEAGGEAGSVNEVTLFNTILITPDNRRVIVPNSSITGGPIVNYSAFSTRRIDMVIGVGYDDDLKQTKQILNDIIKADSRILDNPAPTVAVSELADSSVNFVVRPWVNSGDYWATRFDLTQTIKERLDEAGISIPYPQRDVHVHTVDATRDAA
ncbi:MAG: mechanosensitive ion channel domain-containing protein [Pseudomonadota bacterium]